MSGILDSEMFDFRIRSAKLLKNPEPIMSIKYIQITTVSKNLYPSIFCKIKPHTGEINIAAIPRHKHFTISCTNGNIVIHKFANVKHKMINFKPDILDKNKVQKILPKNVPIICDIVNQCLKPENFPTKTDVVIP